MIAQVRKRERAAITLMEASGLDPGHTATQAVDDARMADRMRNLAILGNFGKAALCLCSIPLLPIHDEAMRILQAKIAKGAPFPAKPASAPAAE